MSDGISKRRLEVLVAPVITFVAVVILLSVARVYDSVPVKPPECRLRATFDVPCLTCGGTRSMKSLAAGNVWQAIRFNPAVVLGVVASVFWFILGWRNYFKGNPPSSIPEQNRKIKKAGLIVLGILFLNWIYLVIYLE